MANEETMGGGGTVRMPDGGAGSGGAASADEIDASGTFYYTQANGCATITGVAGDASIDALTIPSELDGYAVTGIGEYTFLHCDNLTSVTIPDSVTNICMNPFFSCPLTQISVSPKNPVYTVIACVLFDKQQKVLVSYPGAKEGGYATPEGILLIGEEAFSGCEGLTSVTIPDSVTGIGDYAFYDCKSLTSATIPGSVTSIGESTFRDCSSLTSVTIPGSVTSVGESAFSGCSSLTSVTIPDSVTSIDDCAFCYCSSLTSIAIPNSVTSIGESAFFDCSSLTSVTIPGSVTCIGDNAFSNCSSLTSVTIPGSVTGIGANPFRGCPLTQINVSSNNPIYTVIDGVLFDKQQKMLVSYPSAKKGEYVIPEKILLIGKSAFGLNSYLTSVTIPNSVTGIGDYAFYDCISLTSITIPGSVTSIGERAFEGCGSLILTVSVDSYAEEYAKKYDLPFTYLLTNDTSWLNG